VLKLHHPLKTLLLQWSDIAKHSGLRESQSVHHQGCQTKKTVKTLMFFDGCPRRLGCTIVLRGKSYEELKKVKLAVQFALFAAYHLSLETSYLADEGATLPKVPSDLQLDKQIFSSSHCQQNLNEFQTIDERTSGNGCIMPCFDASSASQSHLRADLIHKEYVEPHSRADSSQEDYNGGTIDVYPFHKSFNA